MRVVGLSCLTNMAAGVTDRKLDHREVLETGERVAVLDGTNAPSIISTYDQGLICEFASNPAVAVT